MFEELTQETVFVPLSLSSLNSLSLSAFISHSLLLSRQLKICLDHGPRIYSSHVVHL
jgi:hypothetical protein